MEEKEASQERLFLDQEADAWYSRNASVLNKLGAADLTNELTGKAFVSVTWPTLGEVIDLGGGDGRVAAGFISLNPAWRGTVIEPSKKATEAGAVAFPKLTFVQGSICDPAVMPDKQFDLVIVRGVLCWLDRSLLSQALANIDRLVKPSGGHLIISDFFSPGPRANKYKHQEGLFTYKQDYVEPFLALQTYTEVFTEVVNQSGHHSEGDASDPYDNHWKTTVLTKDLYGRYRR